MNFPSPPPVELESWVHEFLRGPGNNLGFSDGLKLEPRRWFGPFEVALADLVRCCGPEPEMKYRNPVEDFERRVGGLVKSLNDGWRPPPLIVNFSGGALTLNDGNHRHEALRRYGATSTSVIIWTTGAKDAQQFPAERGLWWTLEAQAQEAAALGRQGVVGALVVRPDGRVFAQKRSLTRRTFPGCWDLVGGHVEAGETLKQALLRELEEETGWALDKVLSLVKVVDWESPDTNGRPILKREWVVAVTIKGDWDRPRLEAQKATEGRWFGPQDLEFLNENRQGGDDYVHELVHSYFSSGNSLP